VSFVTEIEIFLSRHAVGDDDADGCMDGFNDGNVDGETEGALVGENEGTFDGSVVG